MEYNTPDELYEAARKLSIETMIQIIKDHTFKAIKENPHSKSVEIELYKGHYTRERIELAIKEMANVGYVIKETKDNNRYNVSGWGEQKNPYR